MPSEAELKEELDTLRILRATLESVYQLVEAVRTDAMATGENARTVTELSRRWGAVINDAAQAVGDVQPRNLRAPTTTHPWTEDVQE